MGKERKADGEGRLDAPPPTFRSWLRPFHRRRQNGGSAAAAGGVQPRRSFRDLCVAVCPDDDRGKWHGSGTGGVMDAGYTRGEAATSFRHAAILEVCLM